MTQTPNEFPLRGFAVIEGVLTTGEVAGLVRLLPDEVAGRRHLLGRIPAVRALAGGPPLEHLLAALGCGPVRPVRAVFFDKNPTHNWKVPWHQDLTIAVREQRESAGFGPWSVKDGVPHVQPPVELLARMVTLRVHLDDCDADNGALRVRPGSHRHGRISAEELSRWEQAGEFTCTVRAGGVVAMRPLLLPASSPARNPRHRRVIHLEFSPDRLPEPLKWFDGEGSEA